LDCRRSTSVPPPESAAEFGRLNRKPNQHLPALVPPQPKTYEISNDLSELNPATSVARETSEI
jgi:hypothetical protein